MQRYARIIRPAIIAAGMLMLVLAAGFYWRWPWVTGLWPWADSRLSFIFVTSICTAIAAPILLVGATGEFRAAEAGAMNLTVMYAGGAAYLFLLHGRAGERRLLVTALVLALGVLVFAGIFLWSRRIPWRDPRPAPGPVRAAFALFAAALVIVGVALVRQAPQIFPWPLVPASSTLYGWIFLGAAVYFAHGVARPRWANAAGQLLGFLIYDLVLLPSFLAHFARVAPAHRASLIIYTAVLVFSGALATYYLFVHRATRLWSPPAPATGIEPGQARA